MNIFNSLGSNYNFAFVLKSLFGGFNDSAKENLKGMLEKKYGGQAILVYKGRQAIGLALEAITASQGVASQGNPLRSKKQQGAAAINGFTCFAVYKTIKTSGYEAELLDLEQILTNRHSGESRLVGTTPESLYKIKASDDAGDSGHGQNDGLNLNFSAQELLKAIKKNSKIKVVIIQNTLGYPCNIEGIAKVCRNNNLILIEDLAHCVGTRYSNGKEAGTMGDMVVLSFSQDKIIDAVSGGALIIRNKKYCNKTIQQFNNINNKQLLTDRLYPFFTFIIRKTYPFGVGKMIHFVLKSLNLLSKPMNESFYQKYNLPNWHASLVLDSFSKLNKNLEHRKQIANIYNNMLPRKITSPLINQNINLSSNLRYPILVKNRTSIIDYLKKQSIYVLDIWYDSVDKSLTNAKIVSGKILNLPTHINVSEKDAKDIAKKINHFIGNTSKVTRLNGSRFEHRVLIRFKHKESNK